MGKTLFFARWNSDRYQVEDLTQAFLEFDLALAERGEPQVVRRFRGTDVLSAVDESCAMELIPCESGDLIMKPRRLKSWLAHAGHPSHGNAYHPV